MRISGELNRPTGGVRGCVRYPRCLPHHLPAGRGAHERWGVEEHPSSGSAGGWGGGLEALARPAPGGASSSGSTSTGGASSSWLDQHGRHLELWLDQHGRHLELWLDQHQEAPRALARPAQEAPRALAQRAQEGASSAIFSNSDTTLRDSYFSDATLCRTIHAVLLQHDPIPGRQQQRWPDRRLWTWSPRHNMRNLAEPGGGPLSGDALWVELQR